MKIIDLLNKIANGEEVPERINWGCHSYEWKDYEYKALDELGTPLFSEQAGYTEHCLNDFVEIIEEYEPFEEDKKIEKIKLTNGGLTLHLDNKDLVIYEKERHYINKINEIIDKVNKIGE